MAAIAPDGLQLLVCGGIISIQLLGCNQIHLKWGIAGRTGALILMLPNGRHLSGAELMLAQVTEFSFPALPWA